jgi:antirestriction protein ArdC
MANASARERASVPSVRASDRASVYERITAEIIAAIERGAGAWRMPWHHDGAATHRPVNTVTAKPYRGMNILALWAAAERSRYPSGIWGTYRQWAELGAQVRKGERATLGVVWKTIDTGESGDEAESETKARMFARGFYLFNVAQVDGYAPPETPILPESAGIAHAEAFVAKFGIRIERGGDKAYYRPSTDTVHMPPFERFIDAESELSTRLHECAHATAAAHRLDRDLSGRFGSEAYAMEECVADLAASFVLADLGIAHHPRPDHAAYLASWLTVLKHDPRAIFTAASKAQAVADWMWAIGVQSRNS